MKTSMLFTIALAYLVFGGSSLLLIGNLIVGFVKNFLGADVVVASVLSDNDLPESQLRNFLNAEINGNTARVENFAFRGTELSDYFNDIFGGGPSFTLSSGGDFPENEVNLYAVEESYIETSLIDFYIPKYPQDGFNYEKTRGKDDYIKSLYSDEGLSQYAKDIDPFNVESRNLSDTTSDDVSGYLYDPTQQVKIILPEGIRDVLSISGGDNIKLTVERGVNDSPYVFRNIVRGMPHKVPGFFFLSYKQVRFFLQGICNFQQAFEMTYLYARYTTNSNWNTYSDYIAKEENIANSFFIPKDRLLIRLNEDLDDDERDIIV